MARNTVVKNEHYPVEAETDPLAELSRIMGLDSSGGRARLDDVDFGIDLERELFGDFETAESASANASNDLGNLELHSADRLQEDARGEAIVDEDIDFSFDAADFDVAEDPASAGLIGEAPADIAADDISFAADYDPATQVTDASFVEEAMEPLAESIGSFEADRGPVAPEASGLSFEDELGAMLGEVSQPGALSPPAPVAGDVTISNDLEFDDFAFDEPLDEVVGHSQQFAAAEPIEFEASAETVEQHSEWSGDGAYASESEFAESSLEYSSHSADRNLAVDDAEFEADLNDGLPANELGQAQFDASAVEDDLEAAISEIENEPIWTDPAASDPGAGTASPPIFGETPVVNQAVRPSFEALATAPPEAPRPRFSFVDQKHAEVEPLPEELSDDPFAALAAMAAAPPILRSLGRGNPVALNQETVRPAVSPPASRAPAAPAHVASANTAASSHTWTYPAIDPVAPVQTAAELDFDVADLDFGPDSNDGEQFAAEAGDWQIRSSSAAVTGNSYQSHAAGAHGATVADPFELAGLDEADLDDLLVDDFATELETVEFQDDVVAVADDLDLPELPVDEAATAGRFDEFDTDFADAFRQLGEPNRQASQPVTQASSAATQEPRIQPANARGATDHLDVDFASFERDLEVHGDTFDDADDFDFEPDSDAEDPRTGSRIPLYGAIFGGLLLLAGAGAYASGMFGSSDSGVPALVRADATPVKVKPETPGGVVVPNQDGKVYQRVAGVDPQNPSQEKLVSSIEEPIVPQPRPVSDALPGVDGVQIKSEDRVAPEEASGPQAANEVVALAPRKVRTMVVRPDGTLAPRPEPVAAPVAEAAAPATAGVEPVVVPAAAKPAAPAEVAAVAKPEPVAPSPAKQEPAAIDEAVAAKPVKTTTIKPKAEPEPQQIAAKPEPAQVDMAGGVTATVPAAASGQLWTVQIASQPTREGAQSSYESLARKFGGVIGGKGVNIVQADIEGKGTMWRVRIPAASKSDANILCAKLKTAGGSCFVSR